MPRINVKPASQRLNTGGGQSARGTYLTNRGGLTPSSINPNAANQQFSAVPITKTRTSLGKSVGLAVGLLLQNADQTQERESQILANSAISDYRRKVFNKYHGEFDDQGKLINTGYEHTKEQSALSAYPDFEQFAKNEYDGILDDLEPAVRQKAIIGMMSARDGFLNQASVHRSQQLGAAEKQDRSQLRKDLKRDVVADPSKMNKTNPATGMTLEDQFKMASESPQTADGEWYGFNVDLLNQIYLEQGLDKAKEFSQQALTNVFDSPSHTVQMRTNLLKWQNDADKEFNGNYAQAEKKEKADRKNTHDQTYARLTSERLKGEELTSGQLALFLEADLISTEQSLTYENEITSSKPRTTDPDTFRMWEQRLFQTAADNFVSPNGENWSRGYFGAPGLSTSDETYFRGLEDSFGDPKSRDRYSRGMEELDAYMKPPQWMESIYDQKFGSLRARASKELYTRLASGEKLADITREMEPRYNVYNLEYEDLPRLRDSNIKPATPQELDGEAMRIQIMWNEGQYSEDEAKSQMSLLMDYKKVMPGLTINKAKILGQ